MAPSIGYEFTTLFRFSTKDVENFAAVTGDNNPIHLDAEYAATTRFKKPILHGMLAASIFSKIFGTQFPGNGTIYLGQTLEFKRPMYPDQQYAAVLIVTDCDNNNGKIVVDCQIKDSEGQICLSGTAKLMNRSVFE